MSRKNAQTQAGTAYTNGKRHGICQTCKRKDVPVEMDHGTIPFENIVERFLKERELKVSDIQVQRTEGKLHWELQDQHLVKDFSTFHDSLVQWQTLCIRCHRVKTNEECAARAKKHKRR